jgi:hypothetical protein
VTKLGIMTLVMLAQACRTSAPATAPAPAPASAPASATAVAPASASATAAAAVEDPDCTSAAPVPLLAASTRDHHFAPREEHQATERATIDGTALTIEHAGCADSKGWTLRFQIAAAPARSRDEALRLLRAMRPSADGGSFVAQMIDLVGKIPAAHAGPYAVCLDGTAPNVDGCSFEQGGSFRVYVEKHDGTFLSIQLSFNL